MEEPVTIIDRDVLKVLSVDTRMDIIKILSEGARTPSDISKRLNKSNATIVEHLDAMVKVGLVKKIEQPGKKWVFYTLTERGKGIISSKSRRLIIILSTSILALLGGVYTFVHPYVETFQVTSREAVPLAADKIATPQIISISIYQYISLILVIAGAAGLVYYMLRKNKI
ncbi:winged helix-turn-helix transcriptional regulator [archaeon]|nr:winged helix-turn-helix transcriptional regulator [archaeon]